MTIRISDDGTVELEGACASEEAEALLRHLLVNPGATVDWRHCESAHSSIIQVLMAAAPRLLGPPVGMTLKSWVHPWLEANRPNHGELALLPSSRETNNPDR